MRNVKHIISSRKWASLFVTVTIFVTIFVFTPFSHAASSGWLRSEGVALLQKTIVPSDRLRFNYNFYTQQKCDKVSAQIQRNLLSVTKDVCIVYGKSVNLATDEQGYQYVQFKTDKKLYQIVNMSRPDILRLNPGTDTVMRLYTPDSAHSGVGSLSVYNNFAARLTHPEEGPNVYYFNSDDPLYPNDNAVLRTHYASLSLNSRFVVYGQDTTGDYHPSQYVIVDLLSGDTKVFGYYNRSWHGYIGLAVSNNGQEIAVMEDQTIKYWQNKDCAIPFVEESPYNASDPCPGSIITSSQYGETSYTFGASTYGLEFDNGTNELSFYHQSPSTSGIQYIRLQKPDYQLHQLRYLALGDSYSSGEGDTSINPATKQKYYRANTDVEAGVTNPREKCHTSTRSYPYLLAQTMSLDAAMWNTVACSGALTTDIKSDRNYKGQQERLSGFSADLLQSQALNDFIPGREQQIVFVKEYKPKIITLTIGGNDINFDYIINACVNPAAQWTGTCSYAKEDNKKAYLGTQIKNQYANLTKLYKDLSIAADYKAKIYVLGYPQFVDQEPGDIVCGRNVRLSKAEREMANEAVSYLNSVIEAAANAAGVKYVNIEHALDKHQLCDPSPHVTGIALASSSEKQESFHPNAFGHLDITRRVYEELGWVSPETYSNCSVTQSGICGQSSMSEPSLPAYFADAMNAQETPSQPLPVTIEDIIKGMATRIITPDFLLSPDSLTSILLYSDPTNLGNYNVNSEGGLNVDITIPLNIPVGYHTLVVSGKSYSGEPIDLYKIILVQGQNPEDRDEDGILDSVDPCMYVEPAGIDEDVDGIDDGCDLNYEKQDNTSQQIISSNLSMQFAQLSSRIDSDSDKDTTTRDDSNVLENESSIDESFMGSPSTKAQDNKYTKNDHLSKEINFRRSPYFIAFLVLLVISSYPLYFYIKKRKE